jgi:hypothetical protein
LHYGAVHVSHDHAASQKLGEIMNSPDADMPERIPRHAGSLHGTLLPLSIQPSALQQARDLVVRMALQPS